MLKLLAWKKTKNKTKNRLGLVAHSYNPSAQEAKIGRFLLKRSKFQASQGLHAQNEPSRVDDE